MKKSLLIVVSCITSCFALAQEVVTFDNIKYFLENGEAMIIVQEPSVSGDITIPDELTYNGDTYKVTGIAERAFVGTTITGIKLPDGIVDIPDGCFGGCQFMTWTTLPNNVKSLGDYCFHGCYSFTSLKLPNSITSLGDYCFNSCI